jgi:hypothetical protein
MLRRVLAVVVDFFVVNTVWGAVGTFAASRDHPEYSYAGILLYLVAIDLPLTAFFGLSAGRAAAGIRVLRVSDGHAPGVARAGLRIAIVTLTGVVGLLYWTFAMSLGHFFDTSLGRFRLWWDAAAGTALVRAGRTVESEFTRR